MRLDIPPVGLTSQSKTCLSAFIEIVRTIDKVEDLMAVSIELGRIPFPLAVGEIVMAMPTVHLVHEPSMVPNHFSFSVFERTARSLTDRFPSAWLGKDTLCLLHNTGP